jgi:hypothetical protein
MEPTKEIRRRSLRGVFHSTAPTPLDAQVARVCVLFEDLRVEIQGLSQRTDTDLDPAGHRQNYFLRRSLASLNEFGDALERLDRNPAFAAVKAGFDADHGKLWAEALDHLRAHIGKKGHKRILTAIRDDVGGHFGEQAAINAIKALREGEGELEYFVAETGLGGCKLHFAKYLALAAVEHHAHGEDFERWFPKIYEAIHAAYQHAVRAVELVVVYYLWDEFGKRT